MRTCVFMIVAAQCMVVAAQTTVPSSPVAHTVIKQVDDTTAELNGTRYALELVLAGAWAEGAARPLAYMEIHRWSLDARGERVQQSEKTIFREVFDNPQEVARPLGERMLKRPMGLIRHAPRTETVLVVLSNGEGFRILGVNLDATPLEYDGEGQLRFLDPVPLDATEQQLEAWVGEHYERHYRRVAIATVPAVLFPVQKLVDMTVTSLEGEPRKTRVGVRYVEDRPQGPAERLFEVEVEDQGKRGQKSTLSKDAKGSPGDRKGSP